MVSPENIHTSYTVGSEQVEFKNVCVPITTNNEKGGYKFQRINRSVWQHLGGGDEREGS